jgi:D-beta-D-heptose 7-phosphate kinase/D-beta-D-heptose 1-phosphate adenosyltransferase
LSKLISEVRSRGKLLVVDPKGRDFARYRGASVVTPNRREAGEACSLELTSRELVKTSGRMLMDDLGLRALLITEGEHGMTIFENDNEPVHLSSLARNVYDVTGAGDTVIAAFTAAAAAGNNFVTSARLANAAAGLVVGEIGTTRITRDMLSAYLASAENGHIVESLHA